MKGRGVMTEVVYHGDSSTLSHVLAEDDDVVLLVS